MAKNQGPKIINDKKNEDLSKDGMGKEKEARIARTKNANKKGGEGSKYDDRSKKELMEEAKKVGIEGRSIMDKYQLIKALRKANK